MEVTSKFDLFLYIIMNIPLYLALAVLTWKITETELITNASAVMIYLSLVAVYIVQIWKIWSINAHIIKKPVPEIHKYKFKQVAILNWAYFVTFGTELAVVSVLAMFYVSWFDVPKIYAALLAGIYPFINLVARPAGGWISDKYGRRKTLLVVFTGISASFIFLDTVDRSWSVELVVAITIIAGIFSKAGSGAVFAMVPLIQRRMTGQFAGMAGAYGNVGAVMFLTVNSVVDYNIFFMIIGIIAVIVLILIMFFLDEPSGQITEVLDDGTVQMIDIK